MPPPPPLAPKTSTMEPTAVGLDLAPKPTDDTMLEDAGQKEKDCPAEGEEVITRDADLGASPSPARRPSLPNSSNEGL